MIIVRQTENGFERLVGNPTLTSLDGTRKARLSVIMHEGWADAEREAFGIFQVEPFELPEGKQAISSPRFEMSGGALVEVIDVEDKPETPKREPGAAEIALTDWAKSMGLTLGEVRRVLRGIR